MMDSGCGRFSAEAVERYCAEWGVSVQDSVGPEQMQIHVGFCADDPERVLRAFEILRMTVGAPKFEPGALERAKRDHRLQYAERMRSIEDRCHNEIFRRLCDPPDRRFFDTTPEQAADLTPQDVEKAVMWHLTPDKMEVIVVGDFGPAVVSHAILDYLGTLP
eukprot:CAMPEP_0113713952 /NCGR_PEP_ID=MMETSP0038_2-20120614/32311_1 /TAXON_ID=2898 /ORGANISM="Cryptomonas paramecium" /LENGTH=161 /DNA_ID=CAMNT_0000640803 /DNA_START=48 /DNA_END=530 /DNA_ORIENTATION=- /assembly_acc=CAM_ASM_000170